MSSYVLLLTPIIFFMITAFILQEALDVDPVGDIIDRIICAWPDYNNGIDNAVVTCSIIDHDTAYASDNAFGFPTGWFQYTADIVTSFFYRVGNVFLVLAVPFLVITPVNATLQAGGVDVLAILFPVFILMYVMLAVGLYKTLSPFVGG